MSKYASSPVWDAEMTGMVDLSPPRVFLKALGSPKFDVERLIDSEMGDVLHNRLQRFQKWPQEMDPELLEYWLGRGLVKELHHTAYCRIDEAMAAKHFAMGLGKTMEELCQRNTKWSAYIPLSSRTQPERKYPLLFCFHGGADPVYSVELFGHVDLAAQEEYILIAPQNCDEHYVSEIYEYAVAHYPVDESRVYMRGFSYGSAMATDNAIARPERFAAVSLFGQLIRTGFWNRPTEKQLKHMKDMTMPMLNIEGDAEGGRTLPMNVDFSYITAIPNTDRRVEANLEGLNAWLEFNHCPRRITKAQMLDSCHSADRVERMIGTIFDDTEIEQHDGRDFCIGNYYDEQGRNMMKIVGIDNLPHFPVPFIAEFEWDFLSAYRRDPQTKQIEITK